MCGSAAFPLNGSGHVGECSTIKIRDKLLTIGERSVRQSWLTFLDGCGQTADAGVIARRVFGTFQGLSRVPPALTKPLFRLDRSGTYVPRVARLVRLELRTALTTSGPGSLTRSAPVSSLRSVDGSGASEEEAPPWSHSARTGGTTRHGTEHDHAV